MTRVRSFDVFDTVLVRRVGTPEAVFRLLGRRLAARGLVAGDAEAFVRARMDAELGAYRAARAKDSAVRLDEVHAELAKALGWDEKQGRAAQAAELELEAELLRPVPAAAADVRAARDRGERIAFVSDTPLPEELLRAALLEHGLLAEGDLLLVSSAAGCGKDGGALFRELARRAEVDPGDILHRGDDARLDGEGARAAGLAVEVTGAAHPTRYEALLSEHGPATGGLADALAGAARLARLSVPVSTAHERALVDVAAGVAAPLLTGYVLWILQRAHEQGLRHLGFLARDGQVLLELARTLAPRLGIQVELGYVHAGRLAWNLPAFAAGAHADLGWIFDRTDDLTATQLLARVGLEPAQVGAELSARGLEQADWTRPLIAGELEALRTLPGEEGFRNKVRAVAQRRATLLTRYLVEEGVLAGGPAAMVELVGHGSQQESLAAVARIAGRPEPEAFYLARIADERKREAKDPGVWLYDERRREGLAGLVPGWGVIALEAFCAADHGTALAFEEKDGSVTAVLASERNAPVLDWGLPHVRRALAAFAEALVVDEDLVERGADVRAAAAAVLERFWLAPSEDEAAAWGAFPWEDGFGTQARHLRLARPYDWGHLGRCLRAGRVAKHHRADWREASLALTPPGRRFALRLAGRLGRLVPGGRRHG